MPCSCPGLAAGGPVRAAFARNRHDGVVTQHSPATTAAGQGPRLAVGDEVQLTVGEVVHGGWCVARPGEDGRGGQVVFVRHALPGERVRAVITQVTAKLARADAVAILAASQDRVSRPCPYAGPGGCGGCDWQHASLPAQRQLKAHVISQQLRRIAGIDRSVTVQELPGHADGLGWRTRVRFAVGKDGVAGLHRHRSHDIVHIADCLIADPRVTEAGVTRDRWPGARHVDVAVAPGTGESAVLVAGGARRGATGRFMTQRAAGRTWRVAAAGFWQVHPAAADVLAGAVLAGLRPAAGETALDLFCGAGLFAGVLAQAVGPAGTVIGIEQDEEAVRDARHNMRQTPWARVHRGDAAEVLGRIGLSGASIAVLDPPRTGADRELIATLCGHDDATGLAGRPGLRAIGYVSCDPATLARDLSVFASHGWHLADLQAFDAFPMTHHVECLAILEPVTRSRTD
jgi:tRNA/tmRNA/rRNA uracil-C5-methylase (TrmA/RlmC/RlmD family)